MPDPPSKTPVKAEQKRKVPEIRTHNRPVPVDRMTKRELSYHAKMRGLLRYIQRPDASLRTIWETERLKDDDDSPFLHEVISWKSLSDTARRDQWLDRRRDHWRRVQDRVLEHAQTEQVQAEVAEIGLLEQVRSAMLANILGDPERGIKAALPKSLEGVIGQLVNVDKRVSQKRDFVAESTAEAATKATQRIDGATPVHQAIPLPMGGELSEDDIRALAEARAERAADAVYRDEPVEISAPALSPQEPEDSDDDDDDDDSV